MLTFKEITLDDKQVIEQYHLDREQLDCNHNFATLYLWQAIYNIEAAEQDGWLFIKTTWEGKTSFLVPSGDGDFRKGLVLLEEYCKNACIPLSFINVTEPEKEELEATFPGRFDFEEDRDSEDYVYSAEKLSTLAGKKLHAKRNFINRFVQTYPDWEVVPISKDNIAEAEAMHRAWCEQNGCDHGLENEFCAVQRALRHFDELGLIGCMIRAGGRTVAYSAASRFGRGVIDVHFEKAFSDVDGAYPIINRELVKLVLSRYPDTVYINREEDMGDEGLRKAKLSYYPEVLVEKYAATLRQEG